MIAQADPIEGSVVHPGPGPIAARRTTSHADASATPMTVRKIVAKTNRRIAGRTGVQSGGSFLRPK